ncbi:right-handed parallel beta-helix repeat-containing protein [Halolamina rubra]|uniref:right-handed parallel beta-helix repeat-containing protein n=1 Tax=Halolamina rubra TaxID=1380430 RepID=UPI0006799255|nr:NosD domain-containing protein [Halolamina rubra]
MVGRTLPLTAFATVFVAALVVLSVTLVVPVGAADDVEPVPFEDTFRLGLTDETVRQTEAQGLSIPRVEVYYSAYEYVVGFNSVGSYVAEQGRTGHEQRFGQPVAAFVSDYAGANASLTDEGYLTAEGEVGFAPAQESVVVVDSRARLPSGPVAVPFSDRDAAAAFVDAYGGEIVPWSAVTDRVPARDPASASALRGAVENRSAWANDAVAATAERERPTSIVVGEDAESLDAAVAAAPPNTTVELPPGTYRTDGLVVNKSLTIAGAGNETTIRGDGNGTVLTIAAARTTLTDLRIDGVGDVGSRRSMLNATEIEGLNWSQNVELAYGRGDAAVRLLDAERSRIEDVSIETPASGIVVLGSRGSVIRESTVTVSGGSQDGFMGLVAMYEPIVVERSQFTGGRDGVYTHRADGLVVRDNAFTDHRFGIHEMYTSDSLLRNNTARDSNAGIFLMTRPSGNLLVDNDVRDSRVGISTAGSRSYVAGNVVADNGRGFNVYSSQSLYTHNTVVGNDVGLRAGDALATNLLTDNDVVGNGQAATASIGPLRVWTVGDSGNYWGAVPGTDTDADGHYERAFRPTGSVDGRVQTTPGAWTLARSPAVDLVRTVQETVPGLRATGVVDVAPRTTPARPETLAELRDSGNATEVAG